MVNPDGAEFDIATGAFALWRKNRQPTPDSLAIGTDTNRNWDTLWGCCDGSSADPNDADFRGPSPFSAVETAQLRDWVDSRVIGGRQQITAHIDWHTFSELVLWPYGYTTDDTVPGLDADAAATFRALGEAMAATNGYTPRQVSDLYVTDGSIDDWMWADTASGRTHSRCTHAASYRAASTPPTTSSAGRSPATPPQWISC